LFDGTVMKFAISRIAPAATKKARTMQEIQSAISLTVFDRDFVEVVEVFEQILCWGGGHLGLHRGDTQGDERDALAAGDLAKSLGAVFTFMSSLVVTALRSSARRSTT
jgi:hypothetical protein